MRTRMKKYLLLAALVAPSCANAALYDVALVDLDGPQIVGQVNTTTNKFVVTSWTENPGGIATWSPTLASLPLTYTAFINSGAVYDVPDNWAGTVDLTWGFIADRSNASIQWNEGVYTEPLRHHGWGGGINDQGGIATQFFTEKNWQWAPTAATLVNTITFNSVSVVPEPATSASIAWGVVLAVFPRRRRPK
jgi:hypothetical protein